jgi:hypothetical protein
MVRLWPSSQTDGRWLILRYSRNRRDTYLMTLLGASRHGCVITEVGVTPYAPSKSSPRIRMLKLWGSQCSLLLEVNRAFLGRAL